MSLKTASRETRLQWFARAVMDAAWMGGDVCGGDIQEWALQAGLIVPDTVTEENRHEIYNGEYFDIGDTFYRFSPDLEDVAWDEIKPDEEEGMDFERVFRERFGLNTKLTADLQEGGRCLNVSCRSQLPDGLMPSQMRGRADE